MSNRSVSASVLLACACASTPASAPAPAAPAAPAAVASKRRTMTALVSDESSTVYCDGERMDSDGYRKTLTRQKLVELPPAGASDTELVRAVVDAVTEGMCQTVMSQLEYRNEGGILHIPPFDAWAGVSITMCSCQPAVEVNFARIPGVTRVVWDGE